jgi:formylmethanofuran dehydrogenase subunit E
MLTWLKPKHCSACEEPMPAHALINFEGDLFCVRCIKPMDKETYYCEGCGEPFPLHHLEYVAYYQAYFCKRCDSRCLRINS